jgi:hypothetical protein
VTTQQDSAVWITDFESVRKRFFYFFKALKVFLFFLYNLQVEEIDWSKSGAGRRPFFPHNFFLKIYDQFMNFLVVRKIKLLIAMWKVCKVFIYFHVYIFQDLREFFL